MSLKDQMPSPDIATTAAADVTAVSDARSGAANDSHSQYPVNTDGRTGQSVSNEP